jgi:hypothetical protein
MTFLVGGSAAMWELEACRINVREEKHMKLPIAGSAGEAIGGQSHRSDDRYERRHMNAASKSPSLLDWYYILRAQHQWTVFQAIRYALWLSR